MSHLPAGLGGRVRSRRRTARPHPSLPPASPGAKMAARPPPHPRTDRDRGQGGRPRTPRRTLEPAPRLSPHALHSTPNGPRSPLSPDPNPGHVRAGTPNSSELHQSDVTHRTPASCGHEPRVPPASRVPPAAALTAEDHGGRGAHDRKKGGVLGAALGLGHVCGGEGASSAGRGGDEDGPSAAGEQQAASTKLVVRGLRRRSARQPLRSKYQHRRTKWRMVSRHMILAPPLMGRTTSIGGGCYGYKTPERLLTAPALGHHPSSQTPAFRPISASAGALPSAASLLDPAALSPSGPPAGAGRWRAH